MLDLLKRLSGWPTYSAQREPRNTDPRTARHWHNPADPVQAARIEAAAGKRAARADKLHHFASRAAVRNPTICILGRYGALESFRKNLYPTYIAK